VEHKDILKKIVNQTILEPTDFHLSTDLDQTFLNVFKMICLMHYGALYRIQMRWQFETQFIFPFRSESSFV